MTRFQSHVINLIKEGPIVTVGNCFSFLRIVLLPVILLTLIQEQNVLTVALIVFAGLTDGLDGYFARRFNQVSNLGKIIDPLADKVTFGAIAYFLVWLRDFPLWAVLVIIGRDLVIISASALLIHYKNSVVPSNIYGKIATFFLFLSTLAYTLRLSPWSNYLLLATVILEILSFIRYGMIYTRLMWRENQFVTE